MTVRARRILFYALFFLFFVFGGAITAYSLGIKLDFKTLSLSWTGGIYLKSEPSDVNIFLNGKPVENKTGFFQSGTLIDNLAKDFYHVTLTRSGYFDWEKKVEVEASLVEVFDAIVLVPKSEPERLADPADNFHVSGGNLILARDGKVVAGNDKIIGSKIEDFVEEGFLITYDEKTKIYYLSDLFEPGSALNINALFNNLKESRLNLAGTVPVIRAAFHPFNRKKLIIQSRGALYSLDTSRLTIEQISGAIFDFRVKGKEVVFYDSKAVYRYNFIFRTKTTIMELNGTDAAIKNLEIDAGNRVIVLFSDGKLLFIENGGKTKNIADKVKIVAPSGNSRFTVFADYDGQIYVYRADKETYLKLETGIEEEIIDIVWYKDDRHLFVKAGNKLYFTEVDDNLPLNTIRIATDVSGFYYKSGTDYLYFSLPGGVYRYKMEI